MHPATSRHHGRFLLETAKSFGSRSVLPHRHRAQLHGQTMHNTMCKRHCKPKTATFNTCRHAARTRYRAEVQNRYDRGAPGGNVSLPALPHSASTSTNKQDTRIRKELVRSNGTEVNQEPAKPEHPAPIQAAKIKLADGRVAHHKLTDNKQPRAIVGSRSRSHPDSHTSRSGVSQHAAHRGLTASRPPSGLIVFMPACHTRWTTNL